MWETGYAMALGKPLVIVMQDLSILPFDLKDMQALPYDRSQLNSSLGRQLKDVVKDTASWAEPPTLPNPDGDLGGRGIRADNAQTRQRELQPQSIAR